MYTMKPMKKLTHRPFLFRRNSLLRRSLIFMLAAFFLAGCSRSAVSGAAADSSLREQANSVPAGSESQSSLPEAESELASALPEGERRVYEAIPLPQEMRAMWISFLEWRDADLQNADSARKTISTMFDNCVALGLNTVIVAVRPFSDALYPSAVYPWSHFLTGVQGGDPGYDPLALLVEEAHNRNLRIEAWINPYRVLNTVNGPDTLAPNNPAVQHPQLVCDVGGNLWYNPGLAEVRRMVADGVREIVRHYDVDGIHFDDYFYPEFTAEQRANGEDETFDAVLFAELGGQMSLAEWRRDNVNKMVAAAYEAVKDENSTVSFGISPQGNNQNNYETQYSDVRHWLVSEGYVDYVMPQLYWGFAYRTSGGRESFAFANVCAEWAFYPRLDTVRLYAGLGAYRIGVGDGGNNDQDEWHSGHNLADMVTHLRTEENMDGFALFRYAHLYDEEQPLAAEESAALTALLLGQADNAA